MKYSFKTLWLAILLASAPAIALANIKLVTSAEIEIVKTDSDGKTHIKRIAAEKVAPGTEVIYTITATNSGKQPAQKISIKDPIPNHMVYVAGSAQGNNTDISFSVDGGKTYNSPEKLTVKGKDGKQRKASAEDYTHVRWILKFDLQPGQSFPVQFRAKLK